MFISIVNLAFMLTAMLLILIATFYFAVDSTKRKLNFCLRQSYAANRSVILNFNGAKRPYRVVATSDYVALCTRAEANTPIQWSR